jgi:hypothetical protein
MKILREGRMLIESYGSFTNQIYTLKINFKNVTKSKLKLGKYIIKLRIADKGNPSCIKKDTFILYLSSNETKNMD